MGAILSFVVGAGVPYAVLYVGGADLALNSSLPAAIVLLLLAIGVNLLLRVVRRRLALSKADLVMVGFTDTRLLQKRADLFLRFPELRDVLFVSAEETIFID